MARVIDLHHLGNPRVIGTWVDGDVIVDCGPSSTLDTLLEGLGEVEPRALLLTHIHFDHAGAAGTLVARWPQLPVYVHERGARHLADPERLYNSAQRLYGDGMERLWGEMRPVPESNLHVLHGGESILDGAYRVEYTPGHASHHVSYLGRDGTAFVGDVAGVRTTPESPAIPPTPPPDIDVELWHDSIAIVRGWKPERMALTHFDESVDYEPHLDELEDRLDRWAALAHELDQDAFMARVRDEIREASTTQLARTYQQTAPVEQIHAGLARYWQKRDGS